MLRRFQMAQVIAGVSFLLACALIDPVIRFGFGRAYLHAIPAAYPLALTMLLRAMTRTFENNLRGLRMIVPGTLGAAINLAGPRTSQRGIRAALGSAGILLRKSGVRSALSRFTGAVSPVARKN